MKPMRESRGLLTPSFPNRGINQRHVDSMNLMPGFGVGGVTTPALKAGLVCSNASMAWIAVWTTEKPASINGSVSALSLQI